MHSKFFRCSLLLSEKSVGAYTCCIHANTSPVGLPAGEVWWTPRGQALVVSQSVIIRIPTKTNIRANFSSNSSSQGTLIQIYHTYQNLSFNPMIFSRTFAIVSIALNNCEDGIAIRHWLTLSNMAQAHYGRNLLIVKKSGQIYFYQKSYHLDE